MTTYRALEGTDVALASLTVLSPQPDPGEGIQFTKVTTSANMTITRQGPYYEFKWSEMSNANYATILGIFGLDDSASTNVTVYIRDETYQTWVRRSGVAQQPIPGDTARWNIRPRNIVIRVTNLEGVSIDVSAQDDATIADSATVAVP